MPVTEKNIKDKKKEVTAKNILAITAQNAAVAARHEVVVAQGELQLLQATKQAEELEAEPNP